MADSLEKGLFLTPEQIREAPPEVRRWLATLSTPAAAPVRAPVSCTEADIAALLEQLKDDELGCQLVFELGCAAVDPSSGQPLQRAIAISEVVRHTDIENGARVLDCVSRINAVLRSIRRDVNAQLCVLEEGRLRLDPRTQQAIFKVWRGLVDKSGSPAAIRVA